MPYRPVPRWDSLEPVIIVRSYDYWFGSGLRFVFDTGIQLLHRRTEKTYATAPASEAGLNVRHAGMYVVIALEAAKEYHYMCRINGDQVIPSSAIDIGEAH